MAGKEGTFLKIGSVVALGSLLLGVGGGVAGAAFFAGGLKTQDSAIEKSLSDHKSQQQNEYQQINTTLTELQRAVGRIEGKLDKR